MRAVVVDDLTVEAECTTYVLIDPSASFDTITTTFQAWLTALDAVTSGRIVRASLVVYPALPTLKSEPDSTARAQQTGLLSFTGPSSPRRDSVAVPALADSLISAGKIVTATGDVATLITFLQTGGSSLEVTTSDWDGPLTFKDSEISFRKYNNQLEPASFALR